MVRLRRTWRASYVVWQTWIQERGCDLRRRLPFVTPSSCRTTIGDRAFFIAAPRAWNTLPSSVTASETLGTFKRRLKTFKQPARTNNDVEGWHARLNSRANHGRMNMYQLLYLLREEAVLINIGVRLLSDAGTSRLQREKYTRLHSCLRQ